MGLNVRELPRDFKIPKVYVDGNSAGDSVAPMSPLTYIPDTMIYAGYEFEKSAQYPNPPFILIGQDISRHVNGQASPQQVYIESQQYCADMRDIVLSTSIDIPHSSSTRVPQRLPTLVRFAYNAKLGSSQILAEVQYMGDEMSSLAIFNGTRLMQVRVNNHETYADLGRGVGYQLEVGEQMVEYKIPFDGPFEFRTQLLRRIKVAHLYELANFAREEQPWMYRVGPKWFAPMQYFGTYNVANLWDFLKEG